MTTATVRAAYLLWPVHDRLLRERVAALSPEELAIQPTPERWPLWASIGHLACQRVFGLCDFAGEPGAAESPFPNAGFDCPGDDDLEHVWSAEQLVDALDRTFRIIERALDTWTVDSLDEVISHPEWGPGWVRTRGEVLQRQYAHDVWHIAELNESLTRAGLAPIDLWN
jgi:hypothetical protein